MLSKPIPITLLSGFLGSGKTTLLKNILTANHGYKVAVIINDMSALNIDAALIQDHKVTKKEEKLIQLQNGCICCTLRGDLLDELVLLAKSGKYQYIVIESTGISEPMQVAETFATEFSEMLLQEGGEIGKEEETLLREIIDAGGLNKFTKLDTCVTVVDAHNFDKNFETTEFLADRYGNSGQNEEDRTITDLLVDQIEFSDVIIVNKKSSVGKKKLKKIKKIVKSLNPVAKIITTDYSKVPVEDIIGTGLYDFEKASTSAGWLQSVNEMTLREGFGDKSKSKLAPKPETEEYGINNFVYTSRKPFHPTRLYKTLRDKFVIIENTTLPTDGATAESDDEEGSEDESDEESDGEDDTGSDIVQGDDDSISDLEDVSELQIIDNKKKSVFAPMLRSKGFFWLASRHIIRGEWSSAGSMLTMKGGIPWFAVSGPEFLPPEARSLVEKDMKGEFGDRRNEIVFIGVGINKTAITEALDKCLLTDEEYQNFRTLIKNQRNLFYIEKKLQETFEDGFENWIEFDDKDIDDIDQKVEKKLESRHNHTHITA